MKIAFGNSTRFPRLHCGLTDEDNHSTRWCSFGLSDSSLLSFRLGFRLRQNRVLCLRTTDCGECWSSQPRSLQCLIRHMYCLYLALKYRSGAGLCLAHLVCRLGDLLQALSQLTHSFFCGRLFWPRSCYSGSCWCWSPTSYCQAYGKTH